jgi:hypothetical protein
MQKWPIITMLNWNFDYCRKSEIYFYKKMNKTIKNIGKYFSSFESFELLLRTITQEKTKAKNKAIKVIVLSVPYFASKYFPKNINSRLRNHKTNTHLNADTCPVQCSLPNHIYFLEETDADMGYLPSSRII